MGLRTITLGSGRTTSRVLVRAEPETRAVTVEFASGVPQTLTLSQQDASRLGEALLWAVWRLQGFGPGEGI
jgi:hypothetical protein